MENNEESTPELDLDLPPPPAQTSPTAYASNGDPVPKHVTVPSDVAVTGDVDNGGAIASIDDRGRLLSGSGGADLVKKKRGRPRKYDSDGKVRSMTTPRTQPQQGGFTLWSTTTTSFKECSSSVKRGRGRPKFDLASFGELFASTAGGDFTPHVILVNPGEDVAGKILTFAQNGYQGISVLSATGSVSNATLRQPGSYGGLLTHEGHFEILTLTGSFIISESNGIKSRDGGLSVSLAGPDGCVIGGGVAGSLVAANPIQVVIGSFMTNSFTTQKRKINTETPRSAHMIPTPSLLS